MSEKAEPISKYGLPRSSLACLACRSAKSKCDGMIPSAIANQNLIHSINPNNKSDGSGIKQEDEEIRAEVSCSRCSRLNLDCLWRPCQRTGRPTKKRKLSVVSQRKDSSNEPSSSQERMPSEQQEIETSLDSSTFDESNASLFSNDAVSMLSQLLNEPLFLSEELGGGNSCSFEKDFPSSPHNAVESQSPYQSTPPNSQLFEISNRIRRAKTPHSQGQPEIISPPPVNFDEELDAGISHYFDGVGLALPLYDNKDQLVSEGVHCDAQLYVTAALGQTLYEGFKGPLSVKFRTEAAKRISSNEFLDNLMFSSEAQTVVTHLNALILMVYIDYAMNDHNSLAIHLEQARTAALSHSLNGLDDGSVHQTFNVDPNDDFRMESARKVWWELYIIDCIMDVMTNGKMKRQFADIKATVQFPGFKQKDEQEKAMNQIWNLRVRSVSLLIGAVSTFRTSRDQERLRSADTIQANVIAEAQGLLLTTVQARKASSASSSLVVDDWSLQRRQVILFDCLMMLYAGRIHLHRLFWFSDLTLNLNSCSFQRERRIEEDNQDTSNSSSSSSSDKLTQNQQNSISFSVEKIIQSSDSILQLMQIDSDAFFQSCLTKIQSSTPYSIQSTKLPITSSHWPPIGCCQMVASYGLAVHLASEISNDSMDFVKKDSDQALRAQQSISSIGLAEASLGILSQVWPVAASYREEVHVCRLIINQTLPIP